jgi:hypothetical protein
MYNENVLKWCGPTPEEDFILSEDDIIIYDDSEEWYNIEESEADD